MSEKLVEVQNLVKTYEAPHRTSSVVAMTAAALGKSEPEQATGEAVQSSTFDRIKAVDGLSFSIGQGEVIGLVGESGCGKSTVARCVLRLVKPDSGDVIFGGKSILGLRGEHLKQFRRQAQIVFQDPLTSLDPRFTVERTLAEPLRVHTIVNGQEQRKRMMELLDAVHLREDHLHRYPHQLSGGERQRVVIARALATNPHFLVLDEPTSALDASSRVRIIDLLLELKAEFDMTYLVISHDLSIIRHLCNRVIVMYLGRAMEVAATDQIIERPRHPYSEALISAIPIPDPDAQTLRIRLRGEVSTTSDGYRGCPLADRCHRAIEECHTRPQQLDLIDEGHWVTCHRVSEGQI